VSRNLEIGEAPGIVAQDHIPARYNFAKSQDGQELGIELKPSRDYSLEAGDRMILLHSWSGPIRIQNSYRAPSSAMAMRQFADERWLGTPGAGPLPGARESVWIGIASEGEKARWKHRAFRI
jgi:hypothetical protein